MGREPEVRCAGDRCFIQKGSEGCGAFQCQIVYRLDHFGVRTGGARSQPGPSPPARGVQMLPLEILGNTGMGLE